MSQPVGVEIEHTLSGDLPVEGAETRQRERVGQAVFGCFLQSSLGEVAAACAAAEARPNVPGDAIEIATHRNRPTHGVRAIHVGLRPLGRGIRAVVLQAIVPIHAVVLNRELTADRTRAERILEHKCCSAGTSR